jgi:long-chain acyl-CoA synthetase
VNLATIVDGHREDSVALVVEGNEITFGELSSIVSRARGGLIRLGVQPGDRVAVVSGNDMVFVVTHLAAMGVGAVTVPLNPLSPPAALTHELAVTGARVLVAGSEVPGVADIDRSETAELEHVVLGGSERWQVLVTGEPAPVVDRDPDDLAVLLFTSGTVGSPRPAMLTHRNLMANLEQISALASRRPQEGDVALGVLPLFHVFGLNVVLHLGLFSGSTVVLCGRFDPIETAEAIRRHRITHVAGAPAMWAAWLRLDDLPEDAFATVRVATSGAAKLPADVAEGFAARFGVTIAEGYGLTETSPVVTSSTDSGSPVGSIGVPLAGVEVRIVDGDGEPALQDDPGEIWVRGPNVFVGYWNDPEATAVALTPDGWLRTGDVAVVDAAGNLFLVDRAKELVIVSGFNVFPAEVEEVLVEHPDVEAAAVVGVPDPQTGEAVKAWIVAAPGVVVDTVALQDFCRDHLARYKCPTSYVVVDELPVGLTGKVLRRVLR